MIEFINLFALSCVFIAWYFYKWATANNQFFAWQRIPFIKPTFLLGSGGEMSLKWHRMDEYARSIYEHHPKDAPVLGLFHFRQPVLLLRDPALIKQLAVKDFDHFEDHNLGFDPSVDRLFCNSLIMLSGQKWRDMRAALSPAFTGSKMRLMFEMVDECAVNMVRMLENRTSDAPTIRIDTKDMFGRYTSDVIATVAFGIQVNSFENADNELYVHGTRAIANFTSWRAIVRIVAINAFPWLMRHLGVALFDVRAARFFCNMALQTIQTRIKQNIYRPDLLDLLKRLKTQQVEPSTENASNVADGFATVDESAIGQRSVATRQWTDTELAAQCLLFFIAGFQTTSTTLSMLFYELALNPDVQQKLFEECRETARVNEGQLTYEAVQRMSYMDQVVSEVLRKWPPAVLTDRLCVRDYHYDNGEGVRFEVKRGMSVWIPIFALHRDERFYPEPERFRPERFGEQERHHIVRDAYLPFGVGPRNCIGSRFALMEIKSLVFHVVQRFVVERNEHTVVPMRLAKAPGVMRTEHPVIVSFRRRLDV